MKRGVSSPSVAVLRLVREHREKADVVAEFNPTEADMIRNLAGYYERAVMDSIQEWWSLHAVQQAKGWSPKWLRGRCRELEAQGKARRHGGGGHWEMRWDAVLELPHPPVRADELDPEDESMIEELATVS